MADRNFQKKKRNDVKRKRKPVMIFTGEGKNKTEKQYFLSFQEQHGKYSIQFVNTGFDTDPAGMLKSMESAWKRYERVWNSQTAFTGGRQECKEVNSTLCIYRCEMGRGGLQSDDRCYRNSKRIGCDLMIIAYPCNTYIMPKDSSFTENVIGNV